MASVQPDHHHQQQQQQQQQQQRNITGAFTLLC
jgi:hypothetical protein